MLDDIDKDISARASVTQRNVTELIVVVVLEAGSCAFCILVCCVSWIFVVLVHPISLTYTGYEPFRSR